MVRPRIRRAGVVLLLLGVLVSMTCTAAAHGKAHAAAPDAMVRGRHTAGGADSLQMEFKVKTFLSQELEFDQYVFPPGHFPGVHWKNLAMVESAVGPLPLTSEFYDAAFRRVEKAEKPGRYAAVVRTATADGFPVVRYVTLYCATADMDDYGADVPLSYNALPGFHIPASRWQLYRENLRKFSFGTLLMLPRHDPDAAVFLAGLSQLDSMPGPMETPRLRDRQWWTEFKRRTDGRSHPDVQLPTPRPNPPGLPATSLDEPASLTERLQGTPFRRDDLAGLRAICSTWADSGGEPLVALIACQGRVVFHEAFGRTREGTPMSVGSPTWMASITKAMTGALVMQFVDRQLLALDEPLDAYLPELGASGRSPLTLRRLLTHTSGLEWTGEWASDWEPSLENRVAQVQPYLPVGETFSYHRSGYALTGKVLERLTGRTTPQLMARLLLEPLGMARSSVDNTYGGLYATALDLARFGQMLLNRGSYGGLEFLSDSTFRAMLPAPLRLRTGRKDRWWGIGLSRLAGDGFSSSTYGHEAASGALFRVDPDHQLVVVLGRNAIGADHALYQRFAKRFLQAVSAPWAREQRRD